MLCENCNKKDATSVYYSQEEKRLKYLCGKCYKQANSDVALESFAQEEQAKVNIEEKCLNCGLTLKEFKLSGLFGCEMCYKYFNNYITKNILSKFKDVTYAGKKPNMFYVQKQIKELEQMVEICLKNGDLQKATKYGLEIKNLKEQNYERL